MDEWEIPAKEVIMEKLIGEGAFGEVYSGIVKCPIVNPKVRVSVKNSICTHVVIKLLKCEFALKMQHLYSCQRSLSQCINYINIVREDLAG